MLMISGSFIKVYDFVSYAGIIVHESRDRRQIFAIKQCCNLVFNLLEPEFYI